MQTTKILVIRHAEKPAGEPGIMPDGSENPEALTATGWTRANALVGLFDPAKLPAGSPLATPGRLFASGSESLRPKQTITPLAAALALTIATFPKGPFAALQNRAHERAGSEKVDFG